MTFETLVPMVALLVAVGGISGVLAGLLGVGGGIVLVPAFLVALDQWGYEGDLAMQLAVGTSLATIIVTSCRSVFAHHRRGAVDMALLRRLALPVCVGALAGTALAQVASSRVLMGFFGVLGTCVGLYMALGPTVARAEATLPRPWALRGIAGLFGGLSAAMGIGGGSFFVPTLTWFGRPLHQAVATSAGIGILIATPSAAGFLLVPVPADAPPFTFGQVNLVAAGLIVATTFVTAPLGAALTHRLNARLLKRAFGAFLVLTALRMAMKAFL